MDELRSDDPRWIGAYRLMGRLGAGGMGRVYLARSPRGRTVAVKLVRAELAEQDEFRARFRREVQAARRVGGAWTAPVLDADTEAAVPWVATGYVAGPSLHQVVAKGYGPLPVASVRVLAVGLAHALADIHAAGLVHRDLKPSNVMVTIDGPRVIDFGIARALETVTDDGAVTYTGAMVGSPAFMSPEQVRGDRVTPACDVFCLGSVLAYAATGLQPFGAASSGVHAQMFRIVQEPPDLDAVPAPLRELVAACLVKEPELRPSLDAVQERLAAFGEPRVPDGEPWLPGAIVAQLGRQAVRLLELEEVETGSLPMISLTPGPAVPGRTGQSGERAAREAREAHEATYVERPADYPPPGPGPGPNPSPSPEPGAAATPRRRTGRGRSLAVAAVLALLATGATAFVLARQHDGGTGGDGRPATASSAPVSTAPSAGATTGGAPGEATGDQGAGAGTRPPADMVGTWRTTFDSSTPGVNTRVLTVGADGSVRLTGDGPSYSCAWTMRVTAAGPPVQLSPSQVTRGEPATSCLPGEATSLTLLDPTHLRRATADAGRSPLTYEKTG
ncbi:serine/threonine-protein kinase [Streptomyces sp. V4-01]|uniref:Serine/threonine-protein kinase n=1 Tax=Actinacidiphila polyblastidii TaxID=3110430 RepID=A0ABU7PHF6_9ACTN|nr:serine/threonine-protein kinase [Streptomyces sp. V4-01]